MADSKDWSTNSNEALHVRLRHAIKAFKDVHFQPAFTYPIFGNEETIFGYRGLKIQLDYTADTLKPSLSITSDQQYDPVGDTKPDDVAGALKPLLPSLEATTGTAAPSPAHADAKWEPPGELMHQYEANGRMYGIWSATLTDPRARELLKDIQIFVLFFIEGGSFINLDDVDWTMERWRVFFIYSIDAAMENPNRFSYSFVGYSTSYTLFFLDKSILAEKESQSIEFPPSLDDSKLLDQLPCRSRISQFVILPPYQGAGHGAHLYNTMMEHFLAQPTTHEIPVEDPNESFDDLRDYCDIIRLRANNSTFRSLSINASVTLNGSKSQPFPASDLLSPSLLDSLRKQCKIPPRQFSRLVEMQLLSRIPLRNRQPARLTRKDKASDANDRAYYFWRLLVKQRLYKHNLDQLAQLEREERLEKLEETLAGLERDYVRILDGADRRTAKIAEAVVAEDDKAEPIISAKRNGASTARSPATNGRSSRQLKRRIESDDDEDDDSEAEGEVTTNANGSIPRKKSRTAS